MARDHGRILSSIWSDRDFLALGQDEQRFYMFLLSQANLNQAGVLPVTVRRWSASAADLTAPYVEALLRELDQHRFVVWDQDTEELLIRTYIRNDKVYRQPKVMLAMVSDAAEIVSPRLRLALLAELDRLPLHEVPDATPPKGGPSARQVVDECIETLRRTLFAPDDTPDPQQRETLPERVSERVPETLASRGIGNPSANPSGNPHAGARAPSPSPAPAPAFLLPTPPNQPPLPDMAGPEPLAALAEEKIPNFDDFWQHWPRKVGKPDAIKAWNKHIGKNRASPFAVVAACQSYAERCRLTGKPKDWIPYPATWLNRESWNDDLDEVMPLGPDAPREPGRPPPPHCGACDPADRRIEHDDGSIAPCPTCHPDSIRTRP